jgi:hypothetical protein
MRPNVFAAASSRVCGTRPTAEALANVRACLSKGSSEALAGAAAHSEYYPALAYLLRPTAFSLYAKHLVTVAPSGDCHLCRLAFTMCVHEHS